VAEASRSLLWALTTLSRNHLFLVASPERETIKAVASYTLLGVARLRSLWDLANSIVRDRIAGAFVECGCWNGGSGALLARVAMADGRTTWLFDSFEGLPTPSAIDATVAGEVGARGDFTGSEARVRSVLGLAGVPTAGVQIVKGWFKDTLSEAQTGPIALLHVDVDLYDSTIDVLDALYDRVTPGGIVVFDDYAYWQGSKKAVDMFFADRRPNIHRSGYPSVWIRKPT
jgi:O-methyltransferase